MKGRLFWKIFLGFWITFIVIFEGVWLLYEVLRPVPSDITRSLASISLAAATSAVELGGPQTLQAQLASWPANERGRVILKPWTSASRLDENLGSGLVSVKATDPAGHAWWIGYNVTKFRFANHGPLDIPGEIIAIAMATGLIFSGTLAWYLSRPARQMQAGFDRLSAGDFTTRLGPAMGRRTDEIADLARHFDRMAVRLQELVAARDRLLADVSHELRSPLARLQLAIDLARQHPDRLAASQERIRDEAARLDEMVGELLILSKLETGVPSAEEYFDVAEVVKLVTDDARFEATAKGVEIALEIEAGDQAKDQEWVVRGSGKLMRRAVENILRNAVRFSREGQQVRVALSSAGSVFRLDIADQGPGVPPQQLPRLFQPFAAGISGDGQGYGLGLSIAQRAVHALGGAIKGDNRAPSGFVITVDLPAAG